MEEMNKNNSVQEQISQEDKGVKLDKKGATILIVSLVLAIIMILVGALVPALKRNSYNDPYYNGGQYGNQTQSISLNSTKTISTKAYEYYEFEIYISSSNSSNYLYVLIDDGTLSSISRNDTTVSFYSYSSYSFDRGYEFYASYSGTYTIRIYAQSSNLTLRVSTNNYWLNLTKNNKKMADGIPSAILLLIVVFKKYFNLNYYHLVFVLFFAFNEWI